jgi:hypothetical protein
MVGNSGNSNDSISQMGDKVGKALCKREKKDGERERETQVSEMNGGRKKKGNKRKRKTRIGGPKKNNKKDLPAR